MSGGIYTIGHPHPNFCALTKKLLHLKHDHLSLKLGVFIKLANKGLKFHVHGKCCHPKQVCIAVNQCISSKMIFLYSETGIYF